MPGAGWRVQRHRSLRGQTGAPFARGLRHGRPTNLRGRAAAVLTRLRKKKVRDERSGTRLSISERPSRRSEAFAPTTSRIVGRMSTVSTIRSTTSPRSLAWQFHQQRHLKDVGEIALPRSRLAPGAPFAVTRAMIGGDDDERLVVHPDFAQPRRSDRRPDGRRTRPAPDAAGGACRRRPRSLPRIIPSPVHRRLVVRTTVPASGRDVFERHVRQHQMDEVQPRRPIVNRRHELRKHSATAVRSPLPSAPRAPDRILPIRRPQAAVLL